MSASLKTVNYRQPSATPQTQKAAKGQKKNAAGGFSFVINDFERAKRFVILGASDGFYTPGAKFAADNAKSVRKVIDSGQSKELVDYIVEVSTAGRAAKQQPGLFALALASSFGTDEEKQYALSKLPEVARTATTLFEFVGYALQFRSWGRALKRAVAGWYENKNLDQLAYQMVKYQNREGWTHADLLKLTHPKGDNLAEGFNDLSRWALNSNGFPAWNADSINRDALPQIVEGYERAKTASSEENLIDYINEYNLSWEMIPNDKRSENVWKALVNKGIPLGALIRQLPTLTRKNVLKPLSAELRTVVAALTDREKIKKARLHPINILIALKTYESGGRYSRGSNTWTPVREVIDALDKAFYLAFNTVEPTGQRYLLALDTSGSMHGAGVNDTSLTHAEAVGAISLVLQKTEPMTHTVTFTSSGSRGYGFGGRDSGISPLNISSAQRLDDVIRAMHAFDHKWGGTDCSLPMLYALENKIEVDVFVVLTDNDTWAGRIHPHEALAKYRKAINPHAKMVVLATSPSKFSIADPNDAGTLDIAGFDASVPAILAEFSKN